MVRSSRNWEHLTAIELITSLVRVQITFKTIQTPATKEFEQEKLEHKEDHITSNCTAQQVELNTGWKDLECLVI